MPAQIKSRDEILKKLGITALNQMQQETISAVRAKPEVLLLSPTGSGKTLAFLLPVIEQLKVEINQPQVLILVPSRELAIQIEQVVREMGSGFKANAIYGGRAGSRDQMELASPPVILIGTPGRIADHIRRKTFSVEHLSILILDEFDKSLHVGFAAEMEEIIRSLPLKQKILTSATDRTTIPNFVSLRNPLKLNFLTEESSKLQLFSLKSKQKDRLTALISLLGHTGDGRGIIFCNFKDSIAELSDHLWKQQISHASFYGGMEQIERENALIKFRNGSERLLLATDLAARGIDIPQLDFIIHYELPQKLAEFTHRNGRTARMNAEGVAYLMLTAEERVPDYLPEIRELTISKQQAVRSGRWQTLYISGGRKDKISKGDIAGLLVKQGKLAPEQVGIIELKNDCAFVAVPVTAAEAIIKTLNNTKLKKRKVRISLLR